MDKDVLFKQFEEIEGKISGLIEEYKIIKSVNLELDKKNDRLENELKEKISAENRYSQEKDIIKSKIDGLLAMLEDVS